MYRSKSEEAAARAGARGSNYGTSSNGYNGSLGFNEGQAVGLAAELDLVFRWCSEAAARAEVAQRLLEGAGLQEEIHDALCAELRLLKSLVARLLVPGRLAAVLALF